MPVKVLPPKVRDQIAAGEVVERPASVLKELLENALDAGARRVAVELAGGGRELLRVADDGCGMDRDDLALSVERFATSKLASIDDLEAIGTMGFRGEALPSIGSVSRMAVTSRPRGSSAGGWRLTVEGGAKSDPEPAGSAPGTSVEVRDLFFNVPARQKFLKSPRAELDRCLAVVTSLALARPDVAFAVEHEGRSLLDLPPAERLADRVAGLFGPETVEGLAEAGAELGSGARCAGLAGLPTLHRQNGSDVHVFVNRRPVRDRAVSAAVNAAYTGLLPLRRYPVVFLFLDFPPGEVDVNVHPAKAEVRFARPGEVFALIERAVRGALSRAEMAAAGGAEAYSRPEERPGAEGAGRVAMPAPPARAPRAAERPRFTAPARPAADQPRLDLWGQTAVASSQLPVASCQKPTAISTPAVPAAPLTTDDCQLATSPGRFLGQALDGFLLVERADGVMVIDQHALHERMLYEELRAARGGAAPSQGLVIPQAVELSARHAEALRGAHAGLAAMGFDLEEFGARSFLVRAVPAALALSDLAGYLVELAEEISAEGEREAARSDEARRERLLASVACKAAVKAGDRLSREAAEALVRRGLALLGEGMPRTCPHGRPAFFLLDRAELAKRVGRK
ncbi:MAG TPA: DNA mismatch repair endonuclease MutL [Planctomycetota bacterium]|nr:DNA mismatch repair endonuclease MutL [Planctomycetota bacterium]